MQYGSKSNSQSPKPSDMQAESWLNSHISVHSKTMTAILTISNSRVEKKAPPTVLKNWRISGKYKVQRDTHLNSSFFPLQIFRGVNWMYLNHLMIMNLQKIDFLSIIFLLTPHWLNFLLVINFYISFFLTDNCNHKLMKFKVILEK